MSDEKNDLPEETTGKESGKKVDRRDFLQVLATVPVLGLFGYALQKEIRYNKAQKAARSAAKVLPSDLSDLNVALIGAGAQGK
ncbi:MAG: hypothetical protein GH143_06260 [Calditrichaeota bacterium]|nr:hypothetical protein [Calditrichota bacterium]